ncbi:MAG: hypothetical protein RIG61_13355 [Deltaproteobacteria bacterium]
MRVSLAVVIFTYLFSLNAFGFFSGEVHYKWWKNPRIINEMALSDQQVQQIERIFNSYKKNIIVYQKDLKRKESELSKKLRNPECTREEVLKITDDIEDIRASLTRIKVEMYLKVKNVLTPEQEAILHNIKARYKGRSR